LHACRIREDGRRRWPAMSAEDGGGPAGARVCGGVVGGDGDGGVRAQASSGGGGLKTIRVRDDRRAKPL
jgi:hypothetical protein